VGGPAFQVEEVSRAAAFGDIDNDGAVDIVVVNNNHPIHFEDLKRRQNLICS
jgi:hypothetical protein